MNSLINLCAYINNYNIIKITFAQKYIRKYNKLYHTLLYINECINNLVINIGWSWQKLILKFDFFFVLLNIL